MQILFKNKNKVILFLKIENLHVRSVPTKLQLGI